MKHKMAELRENLTEEKSTEVQTSPKLEYKGEKNNKNITNTERMFTVTNLGLIQEDEYEREFERAMQEQENEQHSCSNSDGRLDLHSTTMEGTSTVLHEQEDRTRHDPHPDSRPTPTKPRSEISIAKPSNNIRADEYPSELNPFADDERQGHGTNPFGDSDEDSPQNERKGHGTNPFGDSDDEKTPHNKTILHPQPKPRRSVSSAYRPSKEDSDNSRLKLPVPLPRNLSKSMPTTPNQSPLLHVSHSFRLPGSTSSFAGSHISAYNSIRRKKKPAPPPPISTPMGAVPSQSQTNSTKTNSRPRKSRMAPPPPPPPPPSLTAPNISKLQIEISSISLQDTKK